MGFFYRTIRMVDNGIKPCYVFDGKPPDLKSGVVSEAQLSELLEELTDPAETTFRASRGGKGG